MEKFIVESHGDVLKLTICKHALVNKAFVKILYRILANDERTLLVQLQPNIHIDPEAGEYITRVEKWKRSKRMSIITDLLKESLLVSYSRKGDKPEMRRELYNYEKAALKCMQAEIRQENYYLLN